MTTEFASRFATKTCKERKTQPNLLKAIVCDPVKVKVYIINREGNGASAVLALPLVLYLWFCW